MLKLLSIDPSLSNFGLVTASLNPEDMSYKITSMKLSRAAPNKNKNIRTNSDDLGRCRCHVEEIKKLEEHSDIVLCEIPVGSQSARAMASYGACIGVLSWISKPLIQITPSQVKLAATGAKTASKKEMIDWARKKHPYANWIVVRGKPIAANEHLADAVGVIEAATRVDDFKMMVAMFNKARQEIT